MKVLFLLLVPLFCFAQRNDIDISLLSTYGRVDNTKGVIFSYNHKKQTKSNYDLIFGANFLILSLENPNYKSSDILLENYKELSGDLLIGKTYNKLSISGGINAGIYTIEKQGVYKVENKQYSGFNLGFKMSTKYKIIENIYIKGSVFYGMFNNLDKIENTGIINTKSDNLKYYTLGLGYNF